MSGDKRVQVALRLDPELHQQAVALASFGDETLTAFLARLIQQAVDDAAANPRTQQQVREALDALDAEVTARRAALLAIAGDPAT